MIARSSRVVAVALLAASVGAALALRDSDDSLAALQSAGVIRVGYAVEPPYALLEPDGGVTGEAAEIARHIAARLGIARIDWRLMEFDDLIDQLEARRIDVIAAGMFITAERSRQVAFSEPSFYARPGLLVADGNPEPIESYRQAVSRPDSRIAVLRGSVEEQVIKQLGVQEARLVVVPDAQTGRRAVEAGLADALALSEPAVRWMARHQDLGRTRALIMNSAQGEDAGYQRAAFAFRREDEALREAWNAELRAYLGSAGHREMLSRLGLAWTPPGHDKNRPGIQR